LLEIQPAAVLTFTEGCRVQLKGLKSKKHLTGTVIKIHDSEGKCRVALDANKGQALVKSDMVEVIASA